MTINKLKLTLISGLLMGASFCGSAYAQQGNYSATDAMTATIDSYVNAYPHVTRLEATTILSAEMTNQIIQVLECVKNDNEFAGLHVQHEPRFQINVKYTKSPEWRLKDCTSNPAFKAVKAHNSIADLQLFKDELVGILRYNEIDFMLGISHRSNKLEIDIPKESFQFVKLLLKDLDSNKVKYKLRKVDEVGIVFTTKTSPPSTDMRGNTFIDHQGPENNDCTTGFVVKQLDTNIRGITTAGHCPDTNIHINGYGHITQPGQADASNPANQTGIDLQWMKSAGASLNYISEIAYDNVIPGTNLDVLGEIYSFGIPSGMFLCAVGRQGLPAKQCGNYNGFKTFTAFGVAHSFPSAIQPGSTSPISFTQPGDSGGPVYIEILGGIPMWGIGPSVIALGTIVGFSTSENGILFFSPMEAFNAIGIQIALD